MTKKIRAVECIWKFFIHEELYTADGHRNICLSRIIDYIWFISYLYVNSTDVIKYEHVMYKIYI